MSLSLTPSDRIRAGNRWLSLLLIFLFGGAALAMATPASAASVAAGENSSCALKHNGAAWCWGSADEGLGDAAGTVRSATPVRVKGLTGVTDLAVGYQFACAVKPDRTVTCWGYGDYGQLGHGSEDSSATPVPVALTGNIEAVTAGEYHACALKSGGTVACWGENDDGQLGDGTTDDRATPVLVDGISTAIGVAAGDEHSCAALESGKVKCWGRNDDGQLGDGEDHGFEPIPVDVTGGVNNAIAIAAGDEHSCALRSSGKIACWGYNSDGQLGDDSTDSGQPVPVAVTGLAGATAIAAGGVNSCAITRGGKVHCWGDNERGQLGTTTIAEQSRVPVRVAKRTAAIEVSAGNGQICASSPNRPNSGHDVVRCWGDGAMGQLGNGMLGSSKTPIPVPGLTDVKSVVLGDQHSCALVGNDRVDCWGNNRYGQLGSGGIPAQPSPLSVPGLGGTTALAAGNYFSCAVRNAAGGPDRKISCWGSDDSGQLGVGGHPDGQASTPVDLDLSSMLSHPDAKIAQLEAGNSFACALTRIGDANRLGYAWCWGRSDLGQTGYSMMPPYREQIPVPVHDAASLPALADQRDGPTLATGSNHACVITGFNGEVSCWGANWYGQLGDGAAGAPGDVQGENRMRPVAVKLAGPGSSRLQGAVALYAGYAHTCALLDTGKVMCWGQGTSGQLENGLATMSPYPIQAQIDEVSSLSLGENQSCAVLNNGGISCWGDRFDEGFPVPGDNAPQRTPSPVQGVTDAAAVNVGEYHSCYVTPAGTVSCWASDTQDFRYATAAPHGDGAMPTGHYPVQRVASPVIGFKPPARPNHPRVELRDRKLRLRGLPLKKKGSKPCPKKVKAVVTARVTFKKKGRKVNRVVKTKKFLKLKQTAAGCRVNGVVKLKGRLAKAKNVKLKLAGKGIKNTNRTVKAKLTVTVRGAKLRINRLPVRSTSAEICPVRAKVIVTGATKATRKQRNVRKNALVTLAPVTGCRVTVGFKLPPKLSRAKKIKVTVKGPGLKPARHTLKIRWPENNTGWLR